MDISGKVAIVTGGASGLGLATVRKLASEGARAVILDLPSSEGKRVAEELGAGAVFAAADVIDPHQVQAAVDAAIGLGQLAVAVVANPMLNGEVIRLDGAIRMAPR